MILPSGSQLDRAMACPPSLALPQVKTPASEGAERGSVIHRFLEGAVRDRAAALAAIADEDLRAQCEGIDLSVIPAGAEHEVALGWAPGDAQRYRLSEARGYPDDGYYHCTLDLVGVQGDRAVVLDFKTGLSVVSAWDSWQLRLGALAACKLTGRRKALVGLLFLNHNGTWRMDVAEFDSWDLDDFAEEITKLETRVDTAPLATGSHCRYCPALTVCPAQTTLVRGLLPELQTVETRLAALTPEERGIVWERLGAAEDLLETIKKSLQTMARQEPFPLPNGQTVQEVPRGARYLADGALPALAKLVGVEPVLAAASLTPAEMERRFDTAAVQAMEAGGFVKSKPTSQVRAVGSAKKKALNAPKKEAAA